MSANIEDKLSQENLLINWLSIISNGVQVHCLFGIFFSLFLCYTTL